MLEAGQEGCAQVVDSISHSGTRIQDSGEGGGGGGGGGEGWGGEIASGRSNGHDPSLDEVRLKTNGSLNNSTHGRSSCSSGDFRLDLCREGAVSFHAGDPLVSDRRPTTVLVDKAMDKLVENKMTSVGFKVSEENANIQRVIVDRARSIEVPSIAGEAN